MIILMWLHPLMPARALTALPDMGVDYQTMMVNNAGKLRAAGMKSAVNGDQVTISLSKDGIMTVKNQRSSETISYPLKKIK